MQSINNAYEIYKDIIIELPHAKVCSKKYNIITNTKNNYNGSRYPLLHHENGNVCIPFSETHY